MQGQAVDSDGDGLQTASANTSDPNKLSVSETYEDDDARNNRQRGNYNGTLPDTEY